MMNDKIAFVREVLRRPSATAPPKNARKPSLFLDLITKGSEINQFKRIGLELLYKGSVAVLMAAGGLSTRMESSKLRGDLSIGPITNQSIFSLQGQKILALRERYASQLPWLVMTSPSVHETTVNSFIKNKYFGINPDDVWFFVQESLPVLDTNLNPVQLEDGAYLDSPAGHGNMLYALGKSTYLESLREKGIELIFYFQYPNILEHICDPAMLGYHYLGKYEATIKGFYDYKTNEQVGRIVAADNSLRIVEYHFLHDVKLEPWWHTVPANMGSYVWSVPFLQKCIRKQIRLPFYPVPHHLNMKANKLTRIEQFVFDLLRYTRDTGLVIVNRSEEYAPVKRIKGQDSLESARLALSRQYTIWLKQVGAVPEAPDNRVEINPLYALNQDELKKKIAPGFRYHDGLVLR